VLVCATVQGRVPGKPGQQIIAFDFFLSAKVHNNPAGQFYIESGTFRQVHFGNHAFNGIGVNLLNGGIILALMSVPIIVSVGEDALKAVPDSYREAALSLGATRWEMVCRVLFPAAKNGLLAAVLLGVGRAIGETMIVVMAAGLSANLTANPLKTVTTVTVQIVTLLVGDQEFDSAKTLAAFALALVLFIITLALNMIALHIVRKYREQYE